MQGLRPLLIAAAVAAAPTAHAQTVRAVLFHSPTCPHCRQVIAQDLPVFFEVYGGVPEVARGEPPFRLISNGTLTILFVDASGPAGGPLFDASFTSHPVGADRPSVPRMIVGDSVLIGGIEIPSRLHGIIRGGLAAGGISWPAIPGLDSLTRGLEHAGILAPTTPVPRRGDTAARAAVDRAPAAPPARAAPTDLQALVSEPHVTVAQRFRRDPVGNGLAIVGLAVMVLVLAAVGAGVPTRVGPSDPGLWLPLLAAIGAGVAAYLTYVETSGATAVCGPVGDCNTVQQSDFARLLGVPVGVLGLAGYGLVMVLWVLGQDGRPTAAPARRVLVAVALAGTLFSVYLTVLEPFVIGATCLWCLSSAGLMTAVLWLAAAWRGEGTLETVVK